MTEFTSKVALRKIARRYLPDDIVDRRKQGFVLPMRNWLETWFKSQGTPHTYFASRSFPHLNAARLGELVTADLAAGVQRERLLFAVVLLLEWWQMFQVKRSQLIQVLAERAMPSMA
jgi:asparagine synthase (glutamine-hydrolysing)